MNGPANYLFFQVSAGAKGIEQPHQLLIGVRHDVRNPDVVADGLEMDGQVGFFVVPCHLVIGEKAPGDSVISVGGTGAFSNRVGRAVVIVFAGQIDQIDSDWRVWQVGQLEVIPVGLTIAVVLVRLALNGATEVSRRDALYLPYIAAFEIGGNTQAREEQESEHKFRNGSLQPTAPAVPNSWYWTLCQTARRQPYRWDSRSWYGS